MVSGARISRFGIMGEVMRLYEEFEQTSQRKYYIVRAPLYNYWLI